jgi:excisionase family DNA binding protein
VANSIDEVQDPGVRDLAIADQASRAVERLTAFLSSHTTSTAIVRIRGEDHAGETDLTIPAAALEFLVDILAQLAKGDLAVVPPISSELTTQQAADLLQVSRPYLVKLLDQNRIPYRRVGNRRRILAADLCDYKRRDDRRRQEILDELTREAASLGMYDS